MGRALEEEEDALLWRLLPADDVRPGYETIVQFRSCHTGTGTSSAPWHRLLESNLEFFTSLIRWVRRASPTIALVRTYAWLAMGQAYGLAAGESLPASGVN